MKSFPLAAAAAHARTRAIVGLLRTPDLKPIDWDLERTAAAAPARPGVLSNYRRQYEQWYSFMPLRDGTPCGPSYIVTPTCPNLADAGFAAVRHAYRVCGRDFDRYPVDMLTDDFESKAVFPDGWVRPAHWG